MISKDSMTLKKKGFIRVSAGHVTSNQSDDWI